MLEKTAAWDKPRGRSPKLFAHSYQNPELTHVVVLDILASDMNWDVHKCGLARSFRHAWFATTNCCKLTYPNEPVQFLRFVVQQYANLLWARNTEFTEDFHLILLNLHSNFGEEWVYELQSPKEGGPKKVLFREMTSIDSGKYKMYPTWTGGIKRTADLSPMFLFMPSKLSADWTWGFKLCLPKKCPRKVFLEKMKTLLDNGRYLNII